MEVKNLLESANTYKSMEHEASRLAEKWSASGLLEGISDKKEQGTMAMILENQAKQIVAEQSSTGTGGSFSAGNGEQWAGVALPLVRKVFAQIAAKDFVSVQPMNLPSGLVFYLDFKYGSNRQPFSSGDNMYGTLDTLDTDATGGLYGAGRFGYTINSASATVAVTGGAANSASIGYEDGVNPSDYQTFTVSLSGTNFDSKGVRAFRLLSGSVDVTSNPESTTVSGNNVTFVVADSSLPTGAQTPLSGSVVYHKQPADNSRGDFEETSTTSISIPEINVELRSEAVVAKTRKLKAQWTPEFAQDLNAYHSIDAEAELTSILSEYISMEIDLEILDMLIQDARTTEKWSAENNKVWNGSAWTTATSDFYNTQGQWFQTLGTKIQKVSNKIHQKTLRGGANFVVVSPSVATILESIPGYAADTNGDKMDFAMGVQKVGQLNSRFRVYKNPYMTENVLLMGFRGSQFLETGAAYCPYIPLMMTPLVYDPNTFTPRKGIMTRYAKKMIRPEFYGKVWISDLELV
jgi:hypothetical protein